MSSTVKLVMAIKIILTGVDQKNIHSAHELLTRLMPIIQAQIWLVKLLPHWLPHHLSLLALEMPLKLIERFNMPKKSWISPIIIGRLHYVVVYY